MRFILTKNGKELVDNGSFLNHAELYIIYGEKMYCFNRYLGEKDSCINNLKWNRIEIRKTIFYVCQLMKMGGSYDKIRD